MDEKATVFIATYSNDDGGFEDVVGVATTYIKGLRILAASRQYWREQEWPFQKLPRNSDSKLFRYRVGEHSWQWISLELKEYELNACV